MTQTKHHITGKNLVLLTQENGLYLLEPQMYSARRPQLKEEAKTVTFSEQEEEDSGVDKMQLLKDPAMPLYDGQIPLKETSFFSYGAPLRNLQFLYSFPTNLESTAQVIAFGHDMFFARLAPEHTYDRLTDQVNILYVFIGIVVGLIVYNVSKSYIDAKKLVEKFILA